MTVLLPLYLMIVAMPPPLGQFVSTVMLGTQGGAIVYNTLADCGCGVPSSPRGPR
jgi:hypothetical protein